MDSLVLGLCLLALGGCARSTFASLVPDLELYAAFRRSQVDVVEPGTATASSLGARLRWQRQIEARTYASPYDTTPAAWAAPCDDADSECLREFAESEAEIAAALRDGSP